MSADLLIEIGTEELPKGACRAADERAAGIVERLLAERRLAAREVRALVSPRRIAVLASAVPERQAAERVEHRGPPERVARDADGWSKAAEGFARKLGRRVDELELRDGFAWLVVDAETATLEAVAQELVDGLVDGLQLPKNMRWGTHQLRFARPIRTLCVLHGERLLDAELAGVRSSRTLRGHRLVRPELELARAEDYIGALADAGVVVPTELRRAELVIALDRAAAAQGASWSDPAGVVDEVVYLVERVHVVAGRYDERYLELPDRVVVTAMQSHQRYLPLERDGGRFPGFLTAVNSDPAADDTVRAGNQRVLSGRLDDAVFSLEQDLKRGLDELAGELDRITFHAKAGSLAEKTVRIGVLVDLLAGAAAVERDEMMAALAAARIAKADQASTLVQEFAELEGYVGEQYARRAGMPEAVARAIGEQFLPVGAGAATPATAAGALLAAADKLDTLATILAIGERPTGSRDPYALRRAAAGLVAIALERGWHLELEPLVRAVHELLDSQGADLALDADALVGAAVPFVLDRVDALLDEEGVGVDLVRASRGAPGSDPLSHAERARALAAAVDGPAFAAVHAAATRARRLAAKNAPAAAPRFDAAYAESQVETELAAAVQRVGTEVRGAAAAHAWGPALAAAAGLAAPLDAFFDGVMVMADEPAVRANRLRLLVDVSDALGVLGDFAEVQR